MRYQTHYDTSIRHDTRYSLMRDTRTIRDTRYARDTRYTDTRYGYAIRRYAIRPGLPLRYIHNCPLKGIGVGDFHPFQFFFGGLGVGVFPVDSGRISVQNQIVFAPVALMATPFVERLFKNCKLEFV